MFAYGHSWKRSASSAFGAGTWYELSGLQGDVFTEHRYYRNPA
jgi:hypothetical protein